MYKPEFFKPAEFKRCVPSCNMSDMNDSFLKILDDVRRIAGIPIVLNSAYRSKDYEISKGRAGTSSHCNGIAVDIRCTSPINRAKIIEAIFNVVVCPRIGVAKNFIHFDIDGTKNPAFWLYQLLTFDVLERMDTIFYVLKYAGPVYKILPRSLALNLIKNGRPCEIVGKYSAEHLAQCALALADMKLI